MAGQNTINYRLQFQADTSLAQQNIEALKASLASISNMKVGFQGGALDEAAKAAQDLSRHLQVAVNQDTGKLNLTKFQASLKQSNQSLATLSQNLLNAGPIGQQSFAKIAMAISQAQAPAYQFGKIIGKLMKTLGNTLRWQVSSRMIMGFTSAISESISYVKDFDKALTDIKIVSDINNTELLNFAKDTHKLAKEVNSTSLEIAKGSAIFFQQGLNTEQSLERMEVVAKMSNITGESAETVSSQMTAIWNNFDDGTKTLESYADTLAYLGAKTAADTNQIATAMQKFAAAADTVGLSYEYASSMVAEVIDRTQMAPEVVGTAFNTILSRMQGLKLGESLEDGVDLNKYGEALDTVGIKILDANNELKDADVILSDLGQKWGTLDDAQKKALATTVAGVRQQTQFMALMEEWPDIEKQVNGLGAGVDFLNKKNEEYADSIQGIMAQYEQAKQDLITKLLDDDFIKDFYRILIDIVELVGEFVDAFGGLKPMILTFVALFAKQLMPHILNGTRSIMSNLSNLFGFSERNVKKLQAEFFKLSETHLSKGLIDPAIEKQLIITRELTSMKQKLQDAVKNQGKLEQELVGYQIEQYEKAAMALEKELEIQHSLEKQVELNKKNLISSSKGDMGKAAAVYNYQQKASKEGASEKFTEEVVSIASNSTTQEIENDLQVARTKQQNYEQKTEYVESRKTKIESLKSERAQREEVVLDVEKTPTDQQTPLPDNYQSKPNVELDDWGKKSKEAFEAKHRIANIDKEILQLEKEIDSVNEGDAENVQEEINKLEEAKNLRAEMLKQERQFNENTVVGKTSFQVEDNASTPVEAEAQDLRNDMLTDLNGVTMAETSPEEGVTTYNTESSIANLQGLIEKQSELTVSTETMTNMEKDFAAELQKVEKNIAKEEKTTSKSLNSRRKMNKELKTAKKDAQNFGKQVEQMAKSLLKGKSGEKVIGNIKKAIENLKKASNMKEVKKNMNVLMDALKQTKSAAQQAGQGIDAAIDQMIAGLKASGANSAQLDLIEKEMKELGLWTAETAKKFQQLRQEISNTKPMATFGSMVSNVLGKLGSFAGSLQMAISGLNMLKTAFTEASTPGEALMNYLMGLTMILPTVSAAFELLGRVKKKDTAATLANIAATISQTFAEQRATGATVLHAAAMAIKEAFKTFGFWGLAAGIAAAVGIGAIFAVGISGAVGAANAGAKKQSEEEESEKQEKLAEMESKNFAESVGEAEDNVKNLEESFTNYNEIAEKLRNCTKGSEEWNEALIENNKQVSEMLEKYPELAKYISMGSDGQLIISEEGQKAMMYAANQELAREQLGKSMHDNKATQDDISTKKETRNSALTKVRHEFGTAAFKDTEELENIINQFGLYNAKEHLDDEQFGLTQAQIEASSAYIDAQIALADAIKENTAATTANSIAIGAQAMTGDEKYENSAYKENIAAIAGDKLTDGGEYDQSEYEGIYDKISKRTAGGEKWDEANNAEIWEEFKEIKGITDENMKDYADFKDGYVQLELYNPETNTYDNKEYSDEYIAQTVAAARKQKESKEYSDIMADQINAFTSEDQADIFTAAVTGNTSFLSEDLLSKSEESINAIIDSMKISEKTLDEMGYGIGGVIDSVEEGEKAFKKFQKEIVESGKGFKNLQKTGTGSLTLIEAESKKIGQTFDENGKGVKEWSADAKRAAEALSKDLSAALGADADLGLDADFVAKNQGVINDFMNGVEGAGDDLRDALEEDALIDIKAKFPDDAEAQQEMQQLHNALLKYSDKEWKIGVEIEDSTFIDQCNQIIAKAGMTAEEAQEYFGKMGYDVELTTEKKKVTETVWNKYYQNTDSDGDGFIDETTVTAVPEVVEGEIDVPAIKTITPNASYGGNINNISKAVSSPQGGSPGGKGGSGGGGSKSKPKKAPKKKETVDRYHEITKEIESLNKELDKYNSLIDVAFGADKLALMDKQIEATQRLALARREEREEAERYFSEDKSKLQNFGYNVQFDENGNISNYEEIMENLYNRQVSAYNSQNEDAIEKIDEEISEWKNAVSLYEEANEKIQDLRNEELNAAVEIANLKLEKLEEEYQQIYDKIDNAIDSYDNAIGLSEEDTFFTRELKRRKLEKEREAMLKAQQQIYDAQKLAQEDYLENTKKNYKEEEKSAIAHNQNMKAIDSGDYSSSQENGKENKQTSTTQTQESGPAKIAEDYNNVNSELGTSIEYTNKLKTEFEDLTSSIPSVSQSIGTLAQSFKTLASEVINNLEQLRALQSTMAGGLKVEVIGAEEIALLVQLIQEAQNKMVGMEKAPKEAKENIPTNIPKTKEPSNKSEPMTEVSDQPEEISDESLDVTGEETKNELKQELYTEDEENYATSQENILNTTEENLTESTAMLLEADDTNEKDVIDTSNVIETTINETDTSYPDPSINTTPAIESINKLQSAFYRLNETTKNTLRIFESLETATGKNIVDMPSLTADSLATGTGGVDGGASLEDGTVYQDDLFGQVRQAIDEAFKATGMFLVGPDALGWGRPVEGGAPITSPYGYRIHPIYGTRKFHTGLDFGVGMGRPIYATKDGIVSSAAWNGGYGNCVIINHGGGISSLYAHASRLLVDAGQPVKKGQMVALVGTTGVSTGAHLHYEIRQNGATVDPAPYVPRYAFGKSNVMAQMALVGDDAAGRMTGIHPEMLVKGDGSGVRIVGAYGPEFIVLDPGDSIIPEAKTKEILSRGNGTIPRYYSGKPITDPTALGYVQKASQETGVPIDVILAVLDLESSGNLKVKAYNDVGYISYSPMAISTAGGLGMLANAGLGALANKAKTDLYSNILAGAYILAMNYQNHKSWPEAIRAYNGSGSRARQYRDMAIGFAQSDLFKNATIALGGTPTDFGAAYAPLSGGTEKSTTTQQSTLYDYSKLNGEQLWQQAYKAAIDKKVFEEYSDEAKGRISTYLEDRLNSITERWDTSPQRRTYEQENEKSQVFKDNLTGDGSYQAGEKIVQNLDRLITLSEQDLQMGERELENYRKDIQGILGVDVFSQYFSEDGLLSEENTALLMDYITRTYSDNEVVQDMLISLVASFEQTQLFIEDVEVEILQKTYEKIAEQNDLMRNQLTEIQNLGSFQRDRYQWQANRIAEEGTFSQLFQYGALIKQQGTYERDAQSAYQAWIQARASANELGYWDASSLTLAEEAITAYQASLDGLYEMDAQIKELYNSFKDERNENIEYTKTFLDSYKTEIESIKEIVELTSSVFNKENDILVKIGESQKALAKNQLDIAVKNYSQLLEMQAEILSAYNSTSEDDPQKKYWKEQLDTINQEIQESSNEVKALWIENINAITEYYKTKVTTAFKSTNEELEQGLNWMNNIQTAQKDYLSDLQKGYELSKMARNVNQEISKLDNIESKNALANIMRKINNYQASSNKMSQYDLSILQKTYEIEKARIALEEAQRAKNTMRLVRNANGGYSYAYVANQAEIDKAQQALEDKTYDLQKYQQEQLDSMIQNLLKSEQDYIKAVSELDPNSEFYEENLKGLEEYWTPRIEGMGKELQKVLNDLNMELSDTSYWSYFETFFAEDGSFLGTADSVSEHLELFLDDIMKKGLETVKNAGEEWDESQKEIMDSVGLTEESLQGEVVDVVSQANKKVSTLSDTLEDAHNKFGGLIVQIKDWTTNSSDLISNLNNGLTEMFNLLSGVKEEVLKDSINSAATLFNLDVKKAWEEISRLKKEWTEKETKITELDNQIKTLENQRKVLDLNKPEEKEKADELTAMINSLKAEKEILVDEQSTIANKYGVDNSQLYFVASSGNKNLETVMRELNSEAFDVLLSQGAYSIKDSNELYNIIFELMETGAFSGGTTEGLFKNLVANNNGNIARIIEAIGDLGIVFDEVFQDMTSLGSMDEQTFKNVLLRELGNNILEIREKENQANVLLKQLQGDKEFEEKAKKYVDFKKASDDAAKALKAIEDNWASYEKIKREQDEEKASEFYKKHEAEFKKKETYDKAIQDFKDYQNTDFGKTYKEYIDLLGLDSINVKDPWNQMKDAIDYLLKPSFDILNEIAEIYKDDKNLTALINSLKIDTPKDIRRILRQIENYGILGKEETNITRIVDAFEELGFVFDEVFADMETLQSMDEQTFKNLLLNELGNNILATRQKEDQANALLKQINDKDFKANVQKYVNLESGANAAKAANEKLDEDWAEYVRLKGEDAEKAAEFYENHKKEFEKQEAYDKAIQDFNDFQNTAFGKTYKDYIDLLGLTSINAEDPWNQMKEVIDYLLKPNFDILDKIAEIYINDKNLTALINSLKIDNSTDLIKLLQLISDNIYGSSLGVEVFRKEGTPTTRYTLFDTGGYTGEWGEEGRLAVLHQKELVLNEEDTKNLLDTFKILAGTGPVDIFRNILTDFKAKKEDLQQNIQITAEFPNVSSKLEIEQAFLDLAQRASQYAGRKKD